MAYLDERGVDFIKTYDGILHEVWHALMEAAGEAGLEVSGHVPHAATLVVAARAGQRTVEHAKDLVYACSHYGETYRAAIRAVLAGEADAEWPDDAERLRESVATFDADRCRAVLEVLAEDGVYYVPTHVTREMEARASEAEYRDDDRMRYVMDRLKGFWQGDLRNMAGVSPEMAGLYRDFFHHGLALTGLPHAAGVPVMAGTDANDTLMFPGFRLHDELELLVEAGLSPMAALRSATAVPAWYLGRGDEFGGIAAGMRADLVLLDADPIADIANTRAIVAVIAGGRVHDRPALDAMLADVAEQAAVPWKASIPTVEVPTEILEGYAGSYRVPSSGMVVRFMAGEDGLQVTAEGMPVIDLHAKSRTGFS